MKLLLFLATGLGLYYTSEGRIFTNCELYRIFKETELDGFLGISAANWICLIYYESGSKTDAFNNEGSSNDYGIFQFDSKLWCNDGKTATPLNACKMSCESLLDNHIYDDIQCAKRVMRDSNGINAWDSWKDNCKGKDLSRFINGCEK